ncbi:unnamed protein product [Durusdinium trenchii]|uniref:TraB domain-containing protein n=5 Tax=Durusdinium trenchii TaxID=1381693 RepID=A0ABP0LHF0_9DINO
MWKAADLGSHQRFKASRHPLVEFLWAIQRSMVRVMRRLALGLGLALAAVHPFDFTMPAKRTADGAAAGHPAATALRARGFGGGASPKDAGPSNNETEMETRKIMEDLLYQVQVAQDLASNEPLRQINVADRMVTLVGGHHISKFFARYVEHIVSQVQPTALVLELCSERLEAIVRGNQHRGSKAKDWMNPDRCEVECRQHDGYGDEFRCAFRAFMEYPKLPHGLLVLADRKESETKLSDDICGPKSRSTRDMNMALQIFSTAALGATKIVAVMGAAHLDGVEHELKDMNMVYGRRKGLEGAEKARRAMAQEIWSKPPPTGFYVSEQGCKKIQERQQKLIQKVPPKKWKAREKLKEGRRDRMFGLIEKLCNSARIMNSLRPDGIEPSSWKELWTWHRSLV